MKSFRRRCGEGITTPVGMRGAGMEGEGKTRGDDGGVKKESERVQMTGERKSQHERER